MQYYVIFLLITNVLALGYLIRGGPKKVEHTVGSQIINILMMLPIWGRILGWW